MGFRAWVCLAAGALVACGPQSGTDAGTGGGAGATGGGSNVAGGGSAEVGGGTAVLGGGSAVVGGGSGVTNVSCQTAPRLDGPSTVTGSTTGAGKDYAPDCTGFANEGEDALYVISVPAGGRLAAHVEWNGQGDAFDPSLYLLSAPCDAVTCIAGVDAAQTGTESLEWVNDSAAARDVYLVVDSYRGLPIAGKATSGDFELSVGLSQPLVGETCSSAVQLTAGQTLSSQPLTGYSSEYAGSSTCAGSAGIDRVYTLTVPAGQVATVLVAPGSTLDPMLSAATSLATCGLTCVVSADSGENGAAEAFSWKNATTDPVELFIVVDAYGTTTGSFSITATLGTPGSDDVCEGATVLNDGDTLAHTTQGYVNDYALQTGFQGCSNSGYAGGDRLYRFTVPPQQRGRVVLAPDAGFNPSLNLLETTLAACNAMPRVCSTGTNVNAAGLSEELSVFNTSDAGRDFFAFVDSSTALGGPYNISYVVDAPAADDTCTTSVTEIPDGGSVAHSLDGFFSDYGGVGAGCLPYGGPDRVYRAHVPAGEKLTATVVSTGDGGFDGVVNFFVGQPACEGLPRTCAAAFDFTLRNQTESGGYINTTANAQDVFVAVGDYERSSTNRTYTLTTSVGPVPAGETCEVPVVVTPPQNFTNQTLVGVSGDVTYAASNNTCIIADGLPDAVYVVEVPAGKELVATATPASSVNVALNLVEGGCTNVTACLAYANAGAAGVAETLRWTNSGATAKTVKIVLLGVPPGTYSINITVP